jgi:endogenous inhibitor of DNA gyrase (YacG/DUF329 family)
MSKPTMPNRKQKGCPQCGKPASPEMCPFCSQGCRDRDLLQWLGEGYRVAGPAANADGHEIDADGLDSEA